jgi:hypothetical protein
MNMTQVISQQAVAKEKNEKQCEKEKGKEKGKEREQNQ